MRTALFAIAAVSALAVGTVGINSPRMNPAAYQSQGYAEFFDGFCQTDAAFRNCSGAEVRLDDSRTGVITGWTLGNEVEAIRIAMDDGSRVSLQRNGFHQLNQVVAEVASVTPGDREFRTYVGG